jgi:hypothetical protein
VYDTDLDGIDGLHAPDRPGVDVDGFTVRGWQRGPFERLTAARELAREALGLKTGNPLWDADNLPGTAGWFAGRIRPYWAEVGAYVNWDRDVVEYGRP